MSTPPTNRRESVRGRSMDHYPRGWDRSLLRTEYRDRFRGSDRSRSRSRSRLHRDERFVTHSRRLATSERNNGVGRAPVHERGFYQSYHHTRNRDRLRSNSRSRRFRGRSVSPARMPSRFVDLPCVIYVGNLPMDMTENTVKGLFHELGCIDFVCIKQPPRARRRYALVGFSRYYDEEKRDAKYFGSREDLRELRLKVETVPKSPQPLRTTDKEYRYKRTGHRAYVTGLPLSWSSTDLDDYSLQFGLTCYSQVDGCGGGLVEFLEKDSSEDAFKDNIYTSGHILFHSRRDDCCTKWLQSHASRSRARGKYSRYKNPSKKTLSKAWICRFARPTARYLGPRSSLLPPDQSPFDHPFKFITKDPTDVFNLKAIVKALPGRPTLDPGDFPNEIRHWIWADSPYGRLEWDLLCQLENGLFGLFISHTTYTDFEGGCGSMCLFLSPDPEALVFFAMSDFMYSRYEQGTAPAPSWNSLAAATVERRLAWAMLGHARLAAAAQPWAVAMGKDTDALGLVGRKVVGGTQMEPLTQDEEA